MVRKGDELSKEKEAKYKKPVFCAILCFFFTNFGFIYLGGWYFLFATVALFVKLFINIFLINLNLPNWFVWIQSVAFAWQAYALCGVRNDMIDDGITDKKFVNSPGIAFVGTLMLFMLMLLFHYTAGALYHAIIMIIDGRILGGLLVIFIGMPIIVYILKLIAGLVITPIQVAILKT